MATFERCNHTELYQLCRRLNLPALPSMRREELNSVLFGEYPELSVPHSLDTWRHGLAGFVLEHWSALQNQVSCPLKSQDPRACFGCLDTQVVACVVDNPQNERLIQLHRKQDK